MPPKARLSGLQKDVLALYRSIIREAVRKDRLAAPSLSAESSISRENNGVCQLLKSSSTSSSSSTTTSYARNQFRKEASLVRRSDFKTIEYKMRKGKKQLQLLSMPGVNVVVGAS